MTADDATIVRHEVKYLLPLARVPALRADLAALLAPDRHNRDLAGGRGYPVRSLYFATHGLHALREKRAGLLDRFKLRVRGYPPVGPGDSLTLEIKRRHGATVRKERAPCDADALALLIAGRHGALLERAGDVPVARRFVAAKASLGANVPLLVEYRREAFHHPSAEVYLRATIDTGCRAAPSDRFYDPPPGLPFVTGFAIFELKTSGAPPSWFPTLARRHRLSPRSVSKFAHACEQFYAPTAEA